MTTFHSFVSRYKPGDEVIVGEEIKGIITKVSFTFDRPSALYTVEWFNSGAMQEGEFFAIQLKEPEQ